MGIASIQDLLFVTAKAHGNVKQSVNSTFAPDGVHTSDWLENQRQTKRLEIKAEYMDKMLRIHDRLRVEGNTILKRIGNIKYPASTNLVESYRMPGEAQIQTALLFLQSKPASKTILSNIEDALGIGRTDFAFALIDSERARLASRSASLAPNAGDEAELRALDEIEARWDLKGELKQLEAERDLIPVIREHAEQFERFISNEHLTGSFVTVGEVQNMTEQATRDNLEAVNFVMQDAGRDYAGE